MRSSVLGVSVVEFGLVSGMGVVGRVFEEGPEVSMWIWAVIALILTVAWVWCEVMFKDRVCDIEG